MSESFRAVRSAAIDGRARNPYYRKAQLGKLYEGIIRHEKEIEEAIFKDHGGTAAEIKAEFWLALQCLSDAHNSINVDRELQDEYAIANAKDAPNAQEAVGIVVIQPASHAFLLCLVSALAPALATGNCIMIVKVSPTHPLNNQGPMYRDSIDMNEPV